MNRIFNLICCGSIDDGKSTLLGRLLLMTNAVKQDQLADALKASRKNGSDTLEPAMLLDGLLGEREQQITIDVAHRYFDYQEVRFHLLDCPGHEQYTQNMAIGAAVADAALIVVDCTKGLMPQTRRHIEICALFGIRRACVCLTKTDLIIDSQTGLPDQKQIDLVTQSIREFLESCHFTCDILPVCALTGYHMDELSDLLIRYAKEPAPEINNKIMHIQSASFYGGKRYYFGRIIGEEPQTGETYLVYDQSHQTPLTVTIKAVHGYGCFELGEDVDIQQGDCLALQPLTVTNTPFLQTVWFENPVPDMLLKHGTQTARVISYTDHSMALDRPIYINTIEEVKQNALAALIDNVSKKTIGCVVFQKADENSALYLEQNEIQKAIKLSAGLQQDLGADLLKRLISELKEQGYIVQS